MPIIQLASIHECSGCMACVDSCPTQSIKPLVAKDGHLYVNIDHDTCIGCHLCEKTCPAVNQSTYATLHFSGSTPYATYATQEKLRKEASSGGTFAAIAHHILSLGGVVFGAELHNNRVRHIAIEKPEDIARLQGSKYMQSNTAGIYKAVKKELDNNRIVLFSGTGCQVAGLLSFIKNHRNIHNLFTIDIICGGVPSSLLVESYIKNNTHISQVAAFRDKAHYTFSYIDKHNEKIKAHPQQRALPLYGYTSGLTNRYSCNDCHFVGAHRNSNITIGDFWHDTHSEVHRSIAICHNEAGLKLLQAAQLHCEAVRWEQFLPYNPRLVYGKSPYSHRPERIYLEHIFARYSYKTIEKIYATKVKSYDIVWLLYKIVSALIQRLHAVKMRRYAVKLLKQHRP